MQFTSILLALAAAVSAQTFTNGTTMVNGTGSGVSSGNNTLPTFPNATAPFTNGTGGSGVSPGNNGLGNTVTTTVFATQTVVVGTQTKVVTVSVVATLPSNAYTTLTATTVLGSSPTVVVVIPVSAGKANPATGVTVTATGSVVTVSPVASASSSLPTSGLPSSKSGATKVAAGSLGALAMLAALLL